LPISEILFAAGQHCAATNRKRLSSKAWKLVPCGDIELKTKQKQECTVYWQCLCKEEMPRVISI